MLVGIEVLAALAALAALLTVVFGSKEGDRLPRPAGREPRGGIGRSGRALGLALLLVVHLVARWIDSSGLEAIALVGLAAFLWQWIWEQRRSPDASAIPAPMVGQERVASASKPQESPDETVSTPTPVDPSPALPSPDSAAGGMALENQAHQAALSASETAIDNWHREVQLLETRLADQTRSVEEMVERLKRRESRLAAYFNQNLAGMCVSSLSKGWLEVNDRLVSMFGYPREEFLQRTWAELTHPEDLAADVAQFERLLKGEIDTYEMEKRYLRRDGTTIHALLAVGCDRGEEGGVTEVFAVIVDLTEVKRAEEARDIASRRVRQILDSSDAAILALNPAGVITECNTRAIELFGWPREELLGQTAATFVMAHASCLPFRGILTRVVAAGRERESRPTRLAGRNRDGREFPIELMLAPLPAGGEPEYSLTVFDLTERIRAEEELRSYANRLKQSNADLEQFAYVASHDLQEPLRAVTGFCQLLELEYGDRLDAEGRSYIAKAVGGTERMRQLISDLLDYSRVTRHGVEFEPHDLTRAAEEARDLWERKIRETGGAIDIDPLPVLPVDRGQLVRVFQNLFGNALKYRSAEPPRVQVTAVERAGDWLLTVRDNGIGIAPEFHQRIFVIFQRLHTRSEHEGTGIGLAICYRIVQRHGGQIWVESQAGEGSAFHFTLPKAL